MIIISKLKVILCSKDEVYNLVRESIEGCISLDPFNILDDKYHCCVGIDSMDSILKYGLLSKRLRKKVFHRQIYEKDLKVFKQMLKKRSFSGKNKILISALGDRLLSFDKSEGEFSLYEEYICSDPFCVNGADDVSLSTMRPEVDFSRMHKNEDLYDPFNRDHIMDIVISEKLRTSSLTTNYFNEHLAKTMVAPSFFTGINVGILKKIEKINTDTSISEAERNRLILDNYNKFRELSYAMDRFNKNRLINGEEAIPLIEDSNRSLLTDQEIKRGDQYTNDGCFLLDTDACSNLPLIKVKK